MHPDDLCEPAPPRVPSIFPCWAEVSQMGHRTCVGYAAITTELGVPMLLVEVPEAEADDAREALPAERVLVAPASLYGVVLTTEAGALAARRQARSWKVQRRALACDDPEEGEEVDDPRDETG